MAIGCFEVSYGIIYWFPSSGSAPFFVKFPNVATGKVLAFGVRFLEFTYVDAVFASLDSFGKYVNAAIGSVDV